MRRKIKWGILKIVALWILFALSIVIYAFADAQTGFNYLLIVTMCFSPLLYIFTFRTFYDTDCALVICLAFMLLSAFWMPKYFRLSTVLYSGMFMCTFLAYRNIIINGKLDSPTYIKFIRYIIYAYFVVLVVQQAQTLFGLPVFNQCWLFETNEYKLNSLSMEPSHTLLIVPLCIFSYMKMMELVRGETKYKIKHILHEDRWIWIMGLYVCFTSGSTSAFITLPCLFCYFLKIKNLNTVFVVVLLIIVGVIVLRFLDERMYVRVEKIFLAVTESPNLRVSDIDASSACRVIPFVEFFKTFDVDWDLILGHGVDQMEIHNTVIITGNPDRHVGAKNILAHFYDFGWISGSCFIYFLYKTTLPRFISFETFFYITTISVVTLNVYVLWLFICLSFTNIYFKRKYEKRRAIGLNYNI